MGLEIYHGLKTEEVTSSPLTLSPSNQPIEILDVWHRKFSFRRLRCLECYYQKFHSRKVNKIDLACLCKCWNLFFLHKYTTFLYLKTTCIPKLLCRLHQMWLLGSHIKDKSLPNRTWPALVFPKTWSERKIKNYFWYSI